MNTYIDLHIGQRAVYYVSKTAQGLEVVVVDIVYPGDKRSPETWTAYANAAFADIESSRTRPLGVRRFILLDEKFRHIIVPDTFQMRVFLKPKQEQGKVSTGMTFDTAIALTARGYRVRSVYWPEEDFIRRTIKGEPNHPSIVRFRGRISDDPAIEYLPYITDEAMLAKWCFATRAKGKEDER